MQERQILSPEFKNEDQIKGYEAYDYEYGAIEQKATKSTVFELFNGVITAIESETDAQTVLVRVHDGYVPFEANRRYELVNDYDEFINRPDFEFDVFSVGKIEMENFWATVGRKNAIGISNKAVTYGKSTIYSVTYNKNVVGFLLNNMTYDGQNSWFLTSVGYGSTARYCFKGTGNYPSVKYKNGKPANRWTRVIDELAANNGTTVNAWSILKSDDSKFFYAELKRHNGVDKATRQQLKAVRRAAGGLPFDLYVEALEEELAELEEELAVNPENVDASLRYDEIADKLTAYGEEHNSDDAVSVYEDYDNWNYYEDNGY